jgi:hypothetical protein
VDLLKQELGYAYPAIATSVILWVFRNMRARVVCEQSIENYENYIFNAMHA